MKLNCKPGDLAVQISGDFPENIGSLYEVIDTYRCDRGEWRVKAVSGAPKSNWRTRINVGEIVWCEDRCLRPLRDNDGTDETLTWRDVPRKVAA